MFLGPSGCYDNMSKGSKFQDSKIKCPGTYPWTNIVLELYNWWVGSCHTCPYKSLTKSWSTSSSLFLSIMAAAGSRVLGITRQQSRHGQEEEEVRVDARANPPPPPRPR